MKTRARKRTIRTRAASRTEPDDEREVSETNRPGASASDVVLKERADRDGVFKGQDDRDVVFKERDGRDGVFKKRDDRDGVLKEIG